VVGDDRVYVATRYGAVALDRETGAREWEYRGVGGDAAGDSDRAEVKRAAVAFDGQRLVLAAEHALHAVSAATGEQHWTHRFEDEVGALPAIGGGRVYVGTRTDVHALSMDGTHRWRFDVGDPFGATLAVTQGRLVTVRDAGTSEGMRVVSVA
jgi:outer membrane protein assembly factor BamB